MSIETTMADYYAARAAEYDRLYCKPERQADLKELARLLEDLLAGTHVFEVACGTGYWTKIVARAAASIVATDINDEMLAPARAKVSDHPNTTFRKAEAYASAAEPRRYTGGLAAFWWSHVPKARLHTFLRSFHCPLLPGARAVFIDNVYVEGNSTPISHADEHGNTYQQRRLDDGSIHHVLKNFPTIRELQAAGADFGTGVRVEFLRYYWVLSYVVRTSTP